MRAARPGPSVGGMTTQPPAGAPTPQPAEPTPPPAAASALPQAAQAGPAAPRPPAESDRLGRAIAPDVARGLMLLGIAIANSTAWHYGRELGILFRPIDASPADTIVDVLCALFIDNRGYPMFAFLFGYGIHQLAAREARLGRPDRSIIALLAKRNAWLLVFGLLHGALLFFGDIMSAYAVAALIALIWLQRAPTAVLWLAFGITSLLFLNVGAGDAGPLAMEGLVVDVRSVSDPDPLAALIGRLTTDYGPSVPWLPFTALSLLPPMVLGLILARTRVLERPWERLRLAKVLGIAAIASAILGGLPFAIGLATDPEPSPLWMLASILSNASGVVVGAGIPCLIALAVAGLERRRLDDPAAPAGPAVRALQALGRRSMSGYLAQSVLFTILMPAWTLGLGGVVGTAGATAIAVGIWLLTLLGAVLLERAGRPGPFEWLHRRLAYGPRTPRPNVAVR